MVHRGGRDLFRIYRLQSMLLSTVCFGIRVFDRRRYVFPALWPDVVDPVSRFGVSCHDDVTATTDGLGGLFGLAATVLYNLGGRREPVTLDADGAEKVRVQAHRHGDAHGRPQSTVVLIYKTR